MDYLAEKKNMPSYEAGFSKNFSEIVYFYEMCSNRLGDVPLDQQMVKYPPSSMVYSGSKPNMISPTSSVPMDALEGKFPSNTSVVPLSNQVDERIMIDWSYFIFNWSYLLISSHIMIRFHLNSSPHIPNTKTAGWKEMVDEIN